MAKFKNPEEIGKEIDRILAEKGLTRQHFCDMYEIPLYRFNRLARGQKIHRVDYVRITRLLGLKCEMGVISVNEKMSKIKEKSKIERTALGWEIKRKLAILKMTQKRFCEVHNIPPGRMAEIVTGKRLALKHRKQIVRLLGIDENEFPPDGDKRR